jgi:hypothetical protein
MEKQSKKGTSYKSLENKATTNIIVRLTEKQKIQVKQNAINNNQTISEYFRALVLKNNKIK